MLKLYHAPRTRSVRIRWLLEELGLPHELETVEFQPPDKVFSQRTPLGKLPVLEDGEVTICESGAILLYLIERHAEGRLAPPAGSAERGPFLQWIFFAEGTLYPPLGTLIWHGLYKQDAAEIPGVMQQARERATAALDFAEQGLGEQEHFLGADFSAADIMLSFSLEVARILGVLDERHPRLAAYLERVKARPAFGRAMS